MHINKIMGISDFIFEASTDLIDNVIHYFDDKMDILNDENIVEFVANNLKISARMNYCNITLDQYKTIERIDWISKAKIWLREYIEDTYV